MRAQARPSQTEMAVLGGLSMEPMTAYALREAIRDVLGHFWSESFGQIYPTLAALEAQGYVERHPGARRGSSVFAVTGSGVDRLRGLLGEPIAPIPPRNGLLLRLFFGRTLGLDGCEKLLRNARDDARRQLNEYHLIAESITEQEHDSPDLPFLLLTISSGRHGAESQVAWAEESLRVLNTLRDRAIEPQGSMTT